MRLKNNQDVLSLQWRKKYLTYVKSEVCAKRKIEALRRQSVYNDNTKEWVIKSLSKELSNETVQVMANRASNISIAKKVINKLSQVYNAGVIRTVDSPNDQVAIDLLTDELDFESFMKKINKFLELQKNVLVQVIPQKVLSDEKELFKIKMKAITPAYYDIILDHEDDDIIRGYVLSEMIIREKNQPYELYQGQRNRDLR